MTPDSIRIAYSIADGYFIKGADREDVRQEALIGAFYAERDYDPGLGVPFTAFVSLCVRRALITAVVKGNRQKARPLNEAVSLQTEWADTDATLGEAIPDPRIGDPERLCLLRDALRRAARVDLSPAEQQALQRHMSDPGAIPSAFVNGERNPAYRHHDNALRRARGKLAFLEAV